MTQNEQVLKHLERYGSITPYEAMEFYGIMRLGARVYDLRHDGHSIERVLEQKVNRYGEKVRYARYRLQ